MEHAGAGLRKLMAELLRGAPPEQAPILAWPWACGPALAAQTRAVGFCQGELQIQVPDQELRDELEKLAPRYRAALNRVLVTPVRRIVFTVSDPPQP